MSREYLNGICGGDRWVTLTTILVVYCAVLIATPVHAQALRAPSPKYLSPDNPQPYLNGQSISPAAAARNILGIEQRNTKSTRSTD